MYFVKKTSNNLLDDFYNFFGKAGNLKTDLEENKDSYTLDIEAPGVSKEEISIEFEDGYLNIKINKNEETNDEKKNYIIKERTSTSINRSYYLEDIDENQIKAKYDNGILHIEAKKLKELKTNKAIEIE